MSSLLEEGDPLPYVVKNPEGKGKFLIVCDHASHNVPQKLNNLGLSEQDLQIHHMTWDVGTRKVAEYLSDILDSPTILANYSRLVIDLNRRTNHPTSISPYTDNESPVPGNLSLSPEDRLVRIKEIYTPYHQKIEAMREEFFSRDIIPAFISIHSFVPRFYKQIRPWEIGVLWRQDGRLPLPTIEYFKKQGFVVGDNEPYDARLLRGTTVDSHADSFGLPNILVEIRNDLIQTDEQCQAWAQRLGDCYKEITQDERIFSCYDGPQAVHDPDQENRYFEELNEKAKRGDL